MTIIRPKIKLLDEEHQVEILKEAKDILENQGIFLENQEAIEIFEQNGIARDGNHFSIPADVVDKCLKSAPSKITLYDREGKESMTLQKDQIHYDPGSAAIFILDEKTGEIREAISKDFARFSKIVGHLDNIEAQKANYSITFDRNSLTEAVYLDDNAGARGTLSIVDATHPEFTASTSVEGTSVWQPEQYLQTIQYTNDGFEGTITVQGSTTGNDWYDVTSATYSAADSNTHYINAEGLFPYMRLSFNTVAGTVGSILVR